MPSSEWWPFGQGVWALNQAVLVLNQNYEPLNVCGERRALSLLLRDKAQVIENSDSILRSISVSFELPSVIRLLYYVRRPVFSRRLSRREILWRDSFTCQYCGKQGKDMTLDHVVPRVRNGPHTWDNVVTACVPCNHKKAGRTPKEAGMQLMREPACPKPTPFSHLMNMELPDSWTTYLPWKQSIASNLARA